MRLLHERITYKIRLRFRRARQRFREWRMNRFLRRHPDLATLLTGLDRYYPKWEGLDRSLKYCLTSLAILKSNAHNCERYRSENCRLKVLLIANGLSSEAIETSVWSDNAFGINCVDALVSNVVVAEIITQVKSGATHEGIRHLIVSGIFGQERQGNQ